ncbi:hypothetical protein INT45_005984 [Circinella minor]|uniref:NADH-ubiquinone oxidoreductase 21kDa subunit N-terminal domain-containing protein n=1 Tax=Circinella minor TaxID=1195481 RepID=A0A8H7VPA5_9FUNG|nr:hypothetical protein INT45_005984 [Circinella minor]
MPVKEIQTPFPVIDTDPSFGRVVRNFRTTDYATLAASTAIAPAAVIGLEKFNPVAAGRSLRIPIRLSVLFGAFGGFLLAYQNSSLRFWGWKENAIEVTKDFEELSQLAKEGKPLYGETNMPAHVQAASAQNSRFAQLKFSLLPWFNFANHNNHGVDTSKYSS